jgi:ParB/RepB/Spo0J family partition protein
LGPKLTAESSKIYPGKNQERIDSKGPLSVDLPVDLIEHNNELRLSGELEIDELALSLSTHGQLTPIEVRCHPTKSNYFQVVFGNRRLAGARKLGWKTIRANIVEADDNEALLRAIVENIHRKDLSDYEKAVFIERLHTVTGKNYSELAEMIKKSAAFVSLHVAMLHLFPKAIAGTDEKDRVLEKLTEKHARVLFKLDDPEDRWNTAKFAVNANLSVRELERICSRPAHSTYGGGLTRAKSIQEIIRAFTTGFNHKDLRPFFESFSSHKFTIFTSYPPFSKLTKETARDYICDAFRRMGQVKETLDEIDIRVCGKFAYVTMEVLFEINHEGVRMKSKTRSTIILEKEKQEGWKIVHAHYSTANPDVFLGLFSPEQRPKIKNFALNKS